jgi:hypothetical protein
VPFKHHAKHRHHIPKPRYRVTNGPEYDAALRRRGRLTVWFMDEAIAAWRAKPRTTPGGQPHYSALAITQAKLSSSRLHAPSVQHDPRRGTVTTVPPKVDHCICHSLKGEQPGSRKSTA